MTNIQDLSGAVDALLEDLAMKLRGNLTDWENVGFVGIRSGGELVARRLVAILGRTMKKPPPLGILDISLYRDDLSMRLFSPEVKSTAIPFNLDNKEIVLIDDVIHTGRSVRAAIDHIVDLGRPRRIYLAVLFDRGERDLPIQPDFAGKKIQVDRDKVIKLDVPEGSDRIILTEVER
ncbi:MAG: bifunctional pyr operon transcriptional regulator/uracil phosphoribosyltransferase PyrR [Thermodesulfobacteriota bacterium]|nr:bifunctional pyr operon transcriptional regulator/uracil phosphoribosyltransferase PyrR [Thermodesulfobacteriota bacterium]